MNLFYTTFAFSLIVGVLSQGSEETRNKCVDQCFNQAGKPATNRTQPECIVDKNWHEASRWCRTVGLQLVGLESQLESQQVVEKILPNTTVGETFWVGGCDHVETNQWYWLETGEDVVEYKNWDFGEPNVAKKDFLRCVMIRGPAAKWVVDDCMNERKFICEMPELCFKPYCITN